MFQLRTWWDVESRAIRELLSSMELFHGANTGADWACRIVQVGRSARGSVLQQDQRRKAATSEWELSTATQQRYPSSQWGHYTSRCRGTSDQCRDLINEEWAHPGVYPCPPRMPFRSVTAVHIYITRRHKYGNSVFSSCYNFWAEVGSSYPD